MLHNGDDVLPFKLVVVIVYSEESPVAECHTLNNWECTNTSLSLSSADVGSVNGRYWGWWNEHFKTRMLCEKRVDCSLQRRVIAPK